MSEQLKKIENFLNKLKENMEDVDPEFSGVMDKSFLEEVEQEMQKEQNKKCAQGQHGFNMETIHVGGGYIVSRYRNCRKTFYDEDKPIL